MPPHTFYLMKFAGGSIAANRTITVTGDGPFAVIVTDRDYISDITGGSVTTVFREPYDSIDAAVSEAEVQLNLSLLDGFVPNRMQEVP
jgi:hypothetical protein